MGDEGGLEYSVGEITKHRRRAPLPRGPQCPNTYGACNHPLASIYYVLQVAKGEQPNPWQGVEGKCTKPLVGSPRQATEAGCGICWLATTSCKSPIRGEEGEGKALVADPMDSAQSGRNWTKGLGMCMGEW
eukprot:GGOE01006172.1.p5 GENE.GGOE01006172.1~~GGOE01006172.1.p5  ORF type:complete len:131 (+),score=9.16 GGOE01006172.1:1024-1416(+)